MVASPVLIHIFSPGVFRVDELLICAVSARRERAKASFSVGARVRRPAVIYVGESTVVADGGRNVWPRSIRAAAAPAGPTDKYARAGQPRADSSPTRARKNCPLTSAAAENGAVPHCAAGHCGQMMTGRCCKYSAQWNCADFNFL